MNVRKFSHVPEYTKYMSIIYGIVTKNKNKQKIVDIPAGNGLLGQKLREVGHEVTLADINKEKKDYVYADMDQPLPFKDSEFDTVICMEGIEHLINPSLLISELCRISKKGGRIIISLPNLQNLYSRFCFMCTGLFYQFGPEHLGSLLNKEKIDLGHITSLSYSQLRYLFKYFGANIIQVSGDRYKKKILIPFLLPFVVFGFFWTYFASKKVGETREQFDLRMSLFQINLLLSRSLIIVFEKER